MEIIRVCGFVYIGSLYWSLVFGMTTDADPLNQVITGYLNTTRLSCVYPLRLCHRRFSAECQMLMSVLCHLNTYEFNSC